MYKSRTGKDFVIKFCGRDWHWEANYLYVEGPLGELDWNKFEDIVCGQEEAEA